MSRIIAPGWAFGSHRRLLRASKNGAIVDEGSGRLDPLHWSARSDTFAGNLALFRPLNVEYDGVEGATIRVRREELGVRRYSAGALSSHADYFFGRFESTFQASDVPGVITGFFLHRNSPHQEIDIEIAGNMPNRLLVNVLSTTRVTKAPSSTTATEVSKFHRTGLRCFEGSASVCHRMDSVRDPMASDDLLVHRRVLWDPTPIPHLPMKLHFTLGPLAPLSLRGALNTRRLPAMALVQSIRVRAHGPSVFEQKVRGLLIRTSLLSVEYPI